VSNRFEGGSSIVRDRMIGLDFLRGIAILAVIGYHFKPIETGIPVISVVQYPLTHYGLEGVTLFFTLSGFLVGGLLLRQYAESGSIQARRFIIRRIFKIWPAYYVLIAFHLIAGRHPAATFLVQNLTHLQNYLGTSITQTWSLAVEEHFYLFLPLMLLLFAHWRMRPSAMLAVLGLLCLAVLAARSLAVYRGEFHAASVYTQYRMDSLLAGVMLAVVYWTMPATYTRLARQKALLVSLIAMLVLWLAFAQRYEWLDKSVGYTIQGIGFVALLVVMLESRGTLTRTLGGRAVSWIGVYSYGIYLWHSIALAPVALFVSKATAYGVPPWVTWCVALAMQLAISLGVGYIAARAIEFPFLRLRDALFPDRQPHSERNRTGLGRRSPALPAVRATTAAAGHAERD
jgi:peptidoglycan/LPS O-acetylase OafA/YrhL